MHYRHATAKIRILIEDLSIYGAYAPMNLGYVQVLLARSYKAL